MFESVTTLLAHAGQPPLLFVRSFGVVDHDQAQSLHFHHTFCLELLGRIVSGGSGFLVRSYSAAKCGWVTAKLFSFETTRPAQPGQPMLLIVRLYGVLSHSCSQTEHLHHTFCQDVRNEIISGGSSFFLRSYSAAKCGYFATRLLLSLTTFPAQLGQPDLALPVRTYPAAHHS